MRAAGARAGVRPHVVLTEPIRPEGIQILERVASVEVLSAANEAELSRALARADAVIVKFARITADLLEKNPLLKVVAKHGVGTDNIDVDAATRLGIQVVNVPGINSNAVAEFAVALALNLLRGIHLAYHKCVAGQDLARDEFLGSELAGKVAGLVGFGNVGRHVARKLIALGAKVLAYDPYVRPPLGEGFEQVLLAPLDGLLQTADIITLHYPLTPETRHLIGPDRIRLMKRTAVLVNVARPEVVDTEALLRALERHELRGAAVDAKLGGWVDPEGLRAALDSGRLILTPHMAALTEEAQSGIARQVAEEVVRVLGGQLPLHPVNWVDGR
ncbi:MAG: hydroxyacid dehydrogenase [Bacillota bacterium]